MSFNISVKGKRNQEKTYLSNLTLVTNQPRFYKIQPLLTYSNKSCIYNVIPKANNGVTHKLSSGFPKCRPLVSSKPNGINPNRRV